MAEEKNKPEPTFIEQAFAIIEENYSDNGTDYGMTIKDHKLLVKILDAHEKYVDEKITSPFVVEISTYFNPIMQRFEEKLDGIAKDQFAIKGDIKIIKEKQEREESRIAELEAWRKKAEDWAAKKKQHVARIEERLEFLDPDSGFTKEILEMKPYIMRWGKFLEWWTPKNWWKMVLIVIGIIMIFVGINFFMHGIGLVSLQNNRHGVIDKIETDIKTGHVEPTVRGVKTYQETDEEIDRRQDQQLAEIKRKTEAY